MTSKDVFIVGVRIVGLLQLAKALDYLLEAFDIATGLFKPYTTTMGGCYTHIVVYLVVGIWLLSGAPDLVRKIYDRSDKKQTGPSTVHDEHTKV